MPPPPRGSKALVAVVAWRPAQGLKDSRDRSGPAASAAGPVDLAALAVGVTVSTQPMLDVRE
ncbi:hypothetical protein QP64_00050, partial [Staphylococcus aureus]